MTKPFDPFPELDKELHVKKSCESAIGNRWPEDGFLPTRSWVQPQPWDDDGWWSLVPCFVIQMSWVHAKFPRNQVQWNSASPGSPRLDIQESEGDLVDFPIVPCFPDLENLWTCHLNPKAPSNWMVINKKPSKIPWFLETFPTCPNIARRTLVPMPPQSLTQEIGNSTLEVPLSLGKTHGFL